MELDRQKKKNIEDNFKAAKKAFETMPNSSKLKDYFSILGLNTVKSSSSGLPKKLSSFEPDLTYDNLMELANGIPGGSPKSYESKLKSKIKKATDKLDEGITALKGAYTPNGKSKTAIIALKKLTTDLYNLDVKKIPDAYKDAKIALDNLNKIIRRSALADFREDLYEILNIIATSIYPAIYFYKEKLVEEYTKPIDVEIEIGKITTDKNNNPFFSVTLNIKNDNPHITDTTVNEILSKSGIRKIIGNYGENTDFKVEKKQKYQWKCSHKSQNNQDTYENKKKDLESFRLSMTQNLFYYRDTDLHPLLKLSVGD